MRNQPTSRRCDKPSCGDPAAASLTFRYDTGEVWLNDLADDPHPSRYDLCQRHAEELTVPRGWQRVDERTAAVHSIAPPVEADHTRGQVAVGGTASGPATPGPSASGFAREDNRYAALSADLPRLAAEVGAAERGEPGAAEPGPTGVRDPAQPGGRDRGEPGGHDPGHTGGQPPSAGAQRPVGPPVTSRGLTPADVPGGGGVVVDFFDRSRERDRAGDEAQPAGSGRREASGGPRLDRFGAHRRDPDGAASDGPDPDGPDPDGPDPDGSGSDVADSNAPDRPGPPDTA